MRSRPAIVFDWLRAEWVFSLAVIVACVLSTYQLRQQVVVFDEWHTLTSGLVLGSWEIFTTLGQHSSVPVSLYFRAIAETVGLNEWTLRAPFFLGGMATFVLAPLFSRRLVGRGTGDVYAWLLALSPLLIYHARFARQ